jgi:hypothetical protein
VLIIVVRGPPIPADCATFPDVAADFSSVPQALAMLCAPDGRRSKLGVRIWQTMQRVSKTAMFQAARTWDAAALESMLEASPELVAATDLKGRTAFHLACA